MDKGKKNLYFSYIVQACNNFYFRKIPSIEDLEEDILEERDKKLKCENEQCRRCKFMERDRCFSNTSCINNCSNSEDCNYGEGS